jgi:hypothetical protein
MKNRAYLPSLALFTLNAALAATEPSLGEVVAQNRLLQEQIARQQRQIDQLASRLTDLQTAAGNPAETAKTAATTDSGRQLRISGEAGLAFFSTRPEGQFPNSEFRIDDAKLFFETPLVQDIYFVAGLDLFIRENNKNFVQFGELYIDFENISGLLSGPDRLVNFRAGRLQIPFGEEYLLRSPLDNPLISHSLSDFWGIDPGVEIYGSGVGLNYVLAVQNGGVDFTRDYDSDKAITLRIGGAPLSWLRLSASAMRTGDLAVATKKDIAGGTTRRDQLSAVWFGNGYFRSLGGAATTTSFHAEAVQGDATARWRSGHVSAALGAVRFDDNDTAADNSRDLAYGYVEVVQNLTPDLYAATRYSRIDAPGGYPLVGWGDYKNYFNTPSNLTEQLERLGLGLGWRIGPPLVLKFEYTFEWGRQTDGTPRDGENFIGTELGLKF